MTSHTLRHSSFVIDSSFPSPASSRRGTVLIVTLWIVFILAGLVLVLARAMRVEAIASANEVASIQAAAVERGAEQWVLALLEQNRDLALTLPEEYFQGVSVGDGGAFWIVRPDFGDPSLPLWGLVDESSKINLNSASVAVLELLPWMNEELAAAIVDWRDTDENLSEFGAENDYYMTLPRPYYCKNSPLETVEELLLVRGFTKDLLYGSSAVYDQSPEPPEAIAAMQQRSGAQNALTGISKSTSTSRRQQPGSPITGVTSQNDWYLTHGLYDFVTIYSSEPASGTSATGETLLNVNSQESQVASYLSETLGASRASALRSRIRPQPQFRNVFDFYRRSGMTLDEFRKVAPRLTASTGNTARNGLINVATAPRDVLLCLTGLEESDIEAIIAARSNLTDTDRNNPAWVAEALPQKAVNIGSLITTSAYQFSADIVATSANGRAFKRCRIVVDAKTSPARIVFRKDLTDQGWPLDRELLASLKNGSFVPSNRLSISSAATGTNVSNSNSTSGGTR